MLAKQRMEELFALYIEINVTITHGSSGDACGLTLCSPYSKWKTVEHDRIVPILRHTYDDRLSFIFSHRYLCYISPLRHEFVQVTYRNSRSTSQGTLPEENIYLTMSSVAKVM